MCVSVYACVYSWVSSPRHCAFLPVADGGAGLLQLRLAENMLNKHLWSDNQEWPSRLKKCLFGNSTHGLATKWII